MLSKQFKTKKIVIEKQNAETKGVLIVHHGNFDSSVGNGSEYGHGLESHVGH